MTGGRLLAFVLAFVAGGALFVPFRRVVAAAGMLTRLSAPGRGDVTSGGVPAPTLLSLPDGFTPARLYLPGGRARRCLVVGHGVHHLGIEEPRLVRFSTELSRAGVAVLTPELADLADYRITRRGASVLALAVEALAARCGGARVGLLGFSFAGGLSLLAAEEESVAHRLAYVASVGGYHDLRRVLAFLLTDIVETPGGLVHRAAHEYGLVVLLHEHVGDLVPEEDAAVAAAAVRAWLTEDRDAAWAIASRRTTGAAEELFLRLATGRAHELREVLGTLLRRDETELVALSPRGALARIPVPVYLLHGSGDTVIPAEETVWASRELAGREHSALVTPLIEHVEVSGEPTLSDRWALVRFIAALL